MLSQESPVNKFFNTTCQYLKRYVASESPVSWKIFEYGPLFENPLEYIAHGEKST